MSDTREPWAYPDNAEDTTTPPTQPSPQPTPPAPPVQPTPTSYTPPPAPYLPYPAASKGNGLAIAALVLGIVGIPLLGLFIPELLALIFGIIMMNKRRPGQPGRKMAVAGMILGIIGLSFFVLYVIGAATSGSK